MKTNKHGELIFDQNDLCDLIMQGTDLALLNNITVDSTVDLDPAIELENLPSLIKYDALVEQLTTEQFDLHNQKQWLMPAQYQQLDIAALVLNLCNSDAELQRCGQELMMYQERGMFDLLRYLKYLVDTMKKHNLIWGVGRGSSVASFVLYKLEVHKIDSLYYDLDPQEFLR